MSDLIEAWLISLLAIVFATLFGVILGLTLALYIKVKLIKEEEEP